MRSPDPSGIVNLAMTVRVLIVDDNVQFLAAARGLLELGGIAVVGVATTSAEALRQAEDYRPDVVVVDADLGGEGGFELTEHLTQVPGRRLVVVLMSTYPEQDLAELIEASSAIGFVPKSQLSAKTVVQLLDRVYIVEEDVEL